MAVVFAPPESPVRHSCMAAAAAAFGPAHCACSALAGIPRSSACRASPAAPAAHIPAPSPCSSSLLGRGVPAARPTSSYGSVPPAVVLRRCWRRRHPVVRRRPGPRCHCRSCGLAGPDIGPWWWCRYAACSSSCSFSFFTCSAECARHSACPPSRSWPTLHPALACLCSPSVPPQLNALSLGNLCELLRSCKATAHSLTLIVIRYAGPSRVGGEVGGQRSHERWWVETDGFAGAPFLALLSLQDDPTEACRVRLGGWPAGSRARRRRHLNFSRRSYPEVSRLLLKTADSITPRHSADTFTTRNNDADSSFTATMSERDLTPKFAPFLGMGGIAFAMIFGCTLSQKPQKQQRACTEA